MYIPIDIGAVCVCCFHQTEIDARAELVSVESDLMLSLLVSAIAEFLFEFSQNVVEIHLDTTFPLCGKRNDSFRVEGIGIIAGQIKVEWQIVAFVESAGCSNKFNPIHVVVSINNFQV